MFRKLMFALFVLVLIVAPNVHAEDDMLPQKREMIKELLLITDAKKLAEKTMDASFEQLKINTLPQMLNTALKQELGADALAKVEPEKWNELINAASVRISDKIQKSVKEKIDIAQITEDISFSLYNKYFTEKELQGLLDFYRSSTGVKALSIMPQMAADSMKAVGESTNKLIIEVYLATMKEEMPRLMNELFPSVCEDDE